MDPMSLFPGGYVCSRVLGMETEVAIGLHPWERHHERPNRLSVDAEMFVPEGAAGGGIVDYDGVRDLVRGWRGRPHVEVLETLAEELLAECFRDARVAAARVRITKTQIFPEARGAGIEVFRRRKA
ncbi:dihydroneopterin aldolase [Sabulicella glaciei]|uniref:Dihydroneopterin aldolase n=1 Tax=Sabulicella glaciei TaxID=2984948 RepID=A0ABT3NV78_9PROT|nr:dihydroneopterin aldolase [Roseococcus sp. MDT2-1-1]MCW8085808.1 dihydroneopterin aldolase [Roseococcus sp. MDT2-1-1]